MVGINWLTESHSSIRSSCCGTVNANNEYYFTALLQRAFKMLMLHIPVKRRGEGEGEVGMPKQISFSVSRIKIWSSIWVKFFAQYCVLAENIHTPPPPHGRDRIFQWGRGVSLPNFRVGRGVTIGKYFQRVLVTRKRVTKKKHKNLPRQFICEDIKHDES